MVARKPSINEVPSLSVHVEQRPFLPVARARAIISLAPAASSAHARWYKPPSPGLGGSKRTS
eukprot:13682655-Ditylum_brightwellii.AAC.1